MKTEEIIINDAAMNELIIPMIKSFIDALDSNRSKAEIKSQVEELLASAQAASDKMAADKLANSQPSQHESHKTKPSHLHIVV